MLRTLGHKTLGTTLRLRRTLLELTPATLPSTCRTTTRVQHKHYAIKQHMINEVEMLHGLIQQKVYDTKVLHNLDQDILRNLGGPCPRTSTSWPRSSKRRHLR